MLHSETKRKIDNARDILVGKIPVPMSQIEQITLAMTYKFMSDIDEDNKLLGGKTFFEGDFEKYAWKNLMDKRLGAQERMNLYSEGLDSMPKNANIPELFRDIFRNAYLPFKDPQTLDRFLKQINEFNYDHSEELGNAFEYLLSTAGSQGDAGQFRTPRHIIDFLVSIVEPTKEDTILDPACGTAGFLISAYKYILNQNTIKIPGDKLSRDEKEKLSKNIAGYDISHDMVRLSLVNLYLHGFADPKISEYDTLSSDDKWNEDFNCILANPPFMTPKGGIEPHSRFSIKASKSEVLFVDYIMEHLTLNGKAGIIVPEGIIFQSANAYKELRKKMIESNFLWGVVSLPSGVFQPYSGVKTSILLFDKQIAKKTDKILFVKVEQDGFDLGAQRREINKNDLPESLKMLLEYKKSVLNDEVFENTSKNVLIIEKSKIKESGDYNLSGERYRENTSLQNSDFEMVELGNKDYFDLYQPETITSKDILQEGPYKVFGANGVIGFYDRYNHEENEVLVTCRGATCGTINMSEPKSWVTGNAMVVKPKTNEVNKNYLFYILKNSNLSSTISGAAQPQITRQGLNPFKIPLPPLEVQEQIVAELDNYQKIIDGAKQIVENYKPKIKIDKSWEVVELGEVCEKITDGSHFSPETKDEGFPYITVRDIENDKIDFINCKFINEKDYNELVKNGCNPIKNDLLFSKDGTVGKVSLVDFDKEFVVLSSLAIIRPNIGIINPIFLKNILKSDSFINTAIENKTGIAIKRIVLKTLKTIKIPLPPLEIQEQIVAKIEEEQKMVESAKGLIEVFEGKIKDRIGEVWGEKSLDGNI